MTQNPLQTPISLHRGHYSGCPQHQTGIMQHRHTRKSEQNKPHWSSPPGQAQTLMGITIGIKRPSKSKGRPLHNIRKPEQYSRYLNSPSNQASDQTSLKSQDKRNKDSPNPKAKHISQSRKLFTC